MKHIIYLFIILFSVSCANEESNLKNTESVADLPDASSYPVQLDMSKYATEFIANCQTCHTPRYIEMQPNFPRKTWAKIVDKMIHVYGAPIDSVTATRIVDYLVWVKSN